MIYRQEKESSLRRRYITDRPSEAELARPWVEDYVWSPWADDIGGHEIPCFSARSSCA